MRSDRKPGAAGRDFTKPQLRVLRAIAAQGNVVGAGRLAMHVWDNLVRMGVLPRTFSREECMVAAQFALAARRIEREGGRR